MRESQKKYQQGNGKEMIRTARAKYNASEKGKIANKLRMQLYRKNNPEYFKEKGRKKYLKNVVKPTFKEDEHYRKLNYKKLALEKCGGAICIGCGQTNIYALSIDHINNDGAEERKGYKNKKTAEGKTSGNGTGMPFYHLIINSSKRDDLQVLCMSCQFIKMNSLNKTIETPFKDIKVSSLADYASLKEAV